MKEFDKVMDIDTVNKLLTIQREILKLDVNHNGWAIGDNRVYDRKISLLDDFLTIKKLMEEIPKLYEKSKTYNSSSSYGLKHEYADIQKKRFPNTNNYSTNGEFICAMILLGYEYKKPESLNIYFKVRCTKDDLVVLK
jgi:hypothetical protein